MSMSASEKALMLERIFAASPVPSPYAKYLNLVVSVKRPLSMAATFSLVFVLISGSVTYAAEKSLPGDPLYAVKTQLVEPIIDKLSFKTEKKLEWEEKKVERRISEAEKLAAEDKLDEERAAKLEKKIEKSSQAFAALAEKTASSTATSSEGHKVKVEKLKKDFVEKIEKKERSERRGESKENNQDNREEKVKRLKEAAVKSLDLK